VTASARSSEVTTAPKAEGDPEPDDTPEADDSSAADSPSGHDSPQGGGGPEAQQEQHPQPQPDGGPKADGLPPADEAASADDAAPADGTSGADGASPGAARLSRAAMPRWLPRAMVLALVLFGLFQLAQWAFLQLVGFLTTVLVAFVLSLAIEPAVDWMARRHVRRGLGTGIVFLVVALAAAFFIAALGTLLVQQLTQLAEHLPSYVDSAVAWYNRTFHKDVSLAQLQKKVLADSGTLKTYAQDIANNAWGVSSTVMSGLFQLFTTAMFTFYFAADGPRLRRTFCSLLPPARQTVVLRAWDIAVTKTGGYLYSRLVQAAISAVAHFVMMWVLGVPYAALLAIFAGLISQFIPTVGTYIGGALPVLLALTVSPMAAVWLLAFEIGYQQVENYVIHPRITAVTVNVHPAVAFGAVLVGAALMGAIGALIAIPVAATLQSFLGGYVRRYAVVEAIDRPRPRPHHWARHEKTAVEAVEAIAQSSETR
jgi:predicted PurR-regulated permease PerM